jgi:type II secretory pathway component PulF
VSLKLSLFRLGFDAEKRAVFYDNVANFTEDGIPTFECLTQIEAMCRKAGDPMADMVRVVLARMKGKHGRAEDLATALRGFVPPTEASLISAGDRSSELPAGLRRAAHIAVAQSRLSSAIRSEMLKPVGYLMLVVALLVFLSRNILPALESVLPRARWPIYAKYLGGLADHAIPLAMGIVTLVVAWLVIFAATAARYSGGVRGALDKHVFPWGLYAQINEAVMLLTVAAMLRCYAGPSGVKPEVPSLCSKEYGNGDDPNSPA